jgi:hypothetical protein
MTDSLRVNQEPLLVYEVRNAKVADSFKNNRLSLEDWSINNQSVALLTPLANASLEILMWARINKEKRQRD